MAWTRCQTSQIASAYACIFACMYIVDLLTVNTMCDFERGGAKKSIIGSSWNNGEKSRLDLCQVHKRSNMIPLVVFIQFDVFKHPSYPAWSVFKYFFVDTHAHVHTHRHDIMCMHARGNSINRGPVRVGPARVGLTRREQSSLKAVPDYPWQNNWFPQTKYRSHTWSPPFRTMRRDEAVQSTWGCKVR